MQSERIVTAARKLPKDFGRLNAARGRCVAFVSRAFLDAGAFPHFSQTQLDARGIGDADRFKILIRASAYVSDFAGVRAGDVVAFFSGRLRTVPRHVGIVTKTSEAEGVYIIETGDRRDATEHRIDQRWARQFHSAWRVEGDATGGDVKRSELFEAVDAGLVGEPISATAVLISVAVSTALSVASYGIQRLLTPKPKGRTLGVMTGDLILSSSFHIPIAEMAGADPGDGLGGGVRLGGNIIWMSAIRSVTTTQQPSGGGGKGAPKPPPDKVVTYYADIAIAFCRGVVTFRRIQANTDTIYRNMPAVITGVVDTGVAPDDDYDQFFPPDPNTEYTRPRDRVSFVPTPDLTGAVTETVVAGAYAGIALYPGNEDQLQDPTMQAAIDAANGAGSTSAHRGLAYIVLKNFNLSKYNGMPSFTAQVEHQSILTFQDLCEERCARVDIDSADCDFSAFSALKIRGVKVLQREAPRKVLDEAADIFNCDFVEADAPITGIANGGASVITIPDADLGAFEGSTRPEGVAPEIDSLFVEDEDLYRRVDVGALDPQRNFDSNSQGDERVFTNAQALESIEYSGWTLTADEMLAIAKRKMYTNHIERELFSVPLPWRYAYITSGSVATIARAEGFTHIGKIGDISGAIPGVQNWSMKATDASVFVQPATGSTGVGFEEPPVPYPGQTIVSFYDGPLLRDTENSINNGSGICAWAVKRTGPGDWVSAILYVEKNNEPIEVATFEAQAIAGTCATVLTANTVTYRPVRDALTVDLYGTEATLESTDEEGLIAGANACIVGDEVCQILTATRDTSDLVNHPNRWNLIIGMRGHRGTEFAVNDHAVGERFVLINSAVKFVPLNLNEINAPRTYKAVTSGQSLDDAAAVSFTFTGGSRKDLSPTNATREDDSAGNSFVKFDIRERLGFGLHNGVGAFGDRDARICEVEITDSSFVAIEPPRRLRVMPWMSMQAVFDDTTNTTTNSTKNLVSFAAITTRSVQVIPQTGNYIEAQMFAGLSPNFEISQIALIPHLSNWTPSGAAGGATADIHVSYSEASLGGGVIETSLFVYESGVLKSTITSTDTAHRNPRVRILMSGSEFRVYRNWSSPSSVPVYVSGIAPAPPYRFGVYVSGSRFARLQSAILTMGPQFGTVYSAKQKQEDGLATGATIYANIYAVSPEVGRGYPLEATLTP